MILSTEEIQKISAAARLRKIKSFTDRYEEEFGGRYNRTAMGAYIEENGSAVADRLDIDLDEAYYLIGLSYLKDIEVKDLPEFDPSYDWGGANTRKIQLERRYKAARVR